MIHLRGAVLGLLAIAAALGAAQSPPESSEGEDEAPRGLVFQLSEGQDGGAPPLLIARPPASPLDEEATQTVLDRLQPWGAEPREEPFALRDDSLPPPRTGRVERTAFPPDATAAGPAPQGTAAARVVRRAPEGDVPLAPHLSVTFSTPMVPVSSHDALGARSVPVGLEPQPPGSWRWVGTRTLLFEPEGRFPMATEYRAQVRPDTRDASGEPVAGDLAWTFSTPPPRVLVRHPENVPARRDGIVFVAFDQRIDRARVLDSVRLRAGGENVDVVLATDRDVEADETVSRLAAQAEAGRWLAFRARQDLPPDASVNVAVSPGTPSAEGSRVTEEPQEWSFRTYGPFRVQEHRCGYGHRPCTPRDPWSVTFTNPVEATSFRESMIRVEPRVPSLNVFAGGRSLVIRGLMAGRTRYRVTLSPEIRDTFGQDLGESPPLTFDVGPAQKALHAPGGDFVVLDPAGQARFPVFSVNHPALEVRAWAVGPDDWTAWHAFRQASWRNIPATPPGRLVLDTTVRPDGPADQLIETRIDLATAFGNDGTGQVVVVVTARDTDEDAPPQAVRAWVQSTRIGLDAFVDEQTLVAWATDLEDARPLPGVRVSLANGPEIRTDDTGLGRLDLSDSPAPLLVARRGTDLALLPASPAWWSEGAGWRRRQTEDQLRFSVFDDRQMYRPGEGVKVKGWVRNVGARPGGDVGLPTGVTELTWSLSDSQGNEVSSGRTGLSSLGSFHLALDLPRTMNLGTARLELASAGATRVGGRHVHSFQVQEFRRPEYEVTASTSAGPHLVGGHATATVTAAYYAGGALPGAEVTWSVVARPASFRPPHWDEFTFGTYVPWWMPRPEPEEPTRTETYQGRTDGAGTHHLRIDFERGDPPRPRHVGAEATVQDVNRQAWTARASVLVHPADRYVGLRGERSFVEKGEPIELDVIVTDLDGEATPGRSVHFRAERLVWRQVAGEWSLVPEDVQERDVVSTAEPVAVSFDGREGGSWRVLARVSDDVGRPNETELRVWVAGGDLPPRPERVEQAEVTLVPDRKEYAAGDVARILVLAPFAPAEGLLTLRRSGLLREERFRVTEASHTLEIPIEEAWTPNVHVQVDLVGSESRDEAEGAPPRPAFARGALDLPVPPTTRRMDVAVEPRDPKLAPGGETILDLSLSDAEGRPVAGGEMAVVVVDEAVLSLTGYRLPDPMDVFYARRGAGVGDHHLRAHVQLARLDELPDLEVEEGVVALGSAAVGGAILERALPASAAMAPMKQSRLRKSEAGPPIQTRTDFSALALFEPRVVTDASGRATVPVRLPDSLTRYRVMVVAASGGQRFGTGESTLVARLPLMVRPSPPRFLNFGDRFELPVVVQNQTDEPFTVDVAVRARNARLLGDAGRRLVVPANDRAEVRFPASAARAGEARFQVGAVSGSLADAAELSLPVWTPATTEAFATYGHIDEGAMAQPIAAPGGVVPEFGGLEVTTSSTALQALTDAFLYLVAYPFECSEQLSSRVLAVAALRDVLAAFDAEGLPEPEELEAAVERDVGLLRALQNGDGGWAFWRRGDRSWPYVSIHATHALVRAREKGFSVPEATLARSLTYLQTIDERIEPTTPDSVRRALAAYALAVRARMGDADPARARSLVNEAGVSGLTFEALGWILPTLAESTATREHGAVRRRLANGVEETAGAAHFTVSYDDGAHLLLHSNRRADAVILEALIETEPAADLVPKLVAGLLAHRRAGRWANTQENVFVLLALDRYFQAYEKTTPDFVARAWLGQGFAGEERFEGHSTDSRLLRIPMGTLREQGGTTDLVLSKDGPGRLYYRVGLRYAPSNLHLEPLDRGFTVERRYEGVDDEGDAVRDADGTWHLRAGARIRARLTMVAPTRRYHVALVDPLPAGLEPVNPALATSGSAPTAEGGVSPRPAPGHGLFRRIAHWWWWERPWFEHQNMRDERVEAFSSLVWDGVHTYDYIARATTPGTFVVPPPRAEEMYAPETFGRGGTDIVVVE